MAAMFRLRSRKPGRTGRLDFEICGCGFDRRRGALSASGPLDTFGRERGALPEGEYFQSDLLGCYVIDAATGKCLGLVAGWQQYGGPPLMEVRVDGREVLIPFVSSICRQVDLTARTIAVDVPEGLLDSVTA